ncbi:hypothetical protein GH714_008356 [Hevea brasiliensis]|uniref:ARM repeat N-terminal plant domain-containing protein n=1 Tax=Hevea brasiliensis TaxID=3981 RepID=A0A6A6NG80_HEVBR|nr:hypothetical protein GH714_008356 [Hevea brasiliensis]
MGSLKKERLTSTSNTANSNTANMNKKQSCTNPGCFFCSMKEQNLSLRRAGIGSCFKEMPVKDSQEHVLVLSGLWNIAMTQPDDPEFPSLGIFDCMARLIQKGINDRSWLLRDENIYVPYYAAHVIGSYTMNKVEFAEKAVESGVGLIRILCYSKNGRKSIAESKEVINNICNLSRSSDDWQYMGIDCLLLLLKDQDTRYKVIEITTLFLVDLVELKSLGDRLNVGEAITKALLLDYKQIKLKVKKKNVLNVLQEMWNLKVERRRREKLMLSEEKAEERRVLVGLIKQQGNHMFWLGNIEEALVKYTEALAMCPLRLRKERMVLHSNRAQCHLLLRDPDAAISDSTRALCLSNPANSHSKSLWRRSQAYDMKGLAKESLMDCIMFINCCIRTETSKHLKIPYFAARMISKQTEATWLFAGAKSRASISQVDQAVQELDGDHDLQKYEEIMKIRMKKKGVDEFCSWSFFRSVNHNGRAARGKRGEQKKAGEAAKKAEKSGYCGHGKACGGYFRFWPSV